MTLQNINLVPCINISCYIQFCRYVNVPQEPYQVAPSIHLFLSRSVMHNHIMRSSTQKLKWSTCIISSLQMKLTANSTFWSMYCLAVKSWNGPIYKFTKKQSIRNISGIKQNGMINKNFTFLLVSISHLCGMLPKS